MFKDVLAAVPGVMAFLLMLMWTIKRRLASLGGFTLMPNDEDPEKILEAELGVDQATIDPETTTELPIEDDVTELMERR